MLRLDSAFGTRLPDQAVAEADTVDDLVATVAAAMRATPVVGTPDKIADKQARMEISVREELRAAPGQARSEEHTSELQSLAYLVCRLLLEKKKACSAPAKVRQAAQETERTAARSVAPHEAG